VRFLFSRGQAKDFRPGSERFRIAHVYEYAPCFGREQTTQAYSGLYVSSAGQVCPFAAASAGDFVFNMGEHSPARKAGMTETHQQVDGASQYWRFSHSRFFVLPKRRKALRINQKTKGDRT
jgi:hypothetical protein